MDGQTLMQRTDSRQAARRRWGMLLLVLGLGGLWGAVDHAIQPAMASAAEPDAPGPVKHPRVCAAVAAYTLATGDHWDQRAAIARATLNRFADLGDVPDCGPALGRILTAGINRYLWQASLDAVDAVQAGDYYLPLACARADTISRIPPADQVLASAPLRAPAARAQCVIGDLEFAEAL